jgi:hypothetical protein
VQQSSIRLLLSLAAIVGFKVWSNDVSQAYIQASVPLLRDVYIRPDCLDLRQNELVRLIKPLYGLGDSGDYWGQT